MVCTPYDYHNFVDPDFRSLTFRRHTRLYSIFYTLDLHYCRAQNLVSTVLLGCESPRFRASHTQITPVVDGLLGSSFFLPANSLGVAPNSWSRSMHKHTHARTTTKKSYSESKRVSKIQECVEKSKRVSKIEKCVERVSV